MGFEEYIQNIIENFFGSLPETVVLILAILYYLKNIKKTTQEFPEEVRILQSDFKTSFRDTRLATEKITKDFVNELKSNVNDTLFAMKEELSEYKNLLGEYSGEIKSLKEQQNLIVQQNMAYVKSIYALLSKDKEFVRKGITNEVNTQLRKMVEETEKNPDKLILNPRFFEDTFKKVIDLLGETEFANLLGRIGYNGKEEK
ncbi:MAG: hypothetical protein PF513_04880 [Tenericutes bacterium]|jgi:hypothetical protein|nr:hypothetical protein [Mycoplasmatota bacterium]